MAIAKIYCWQNSTVSLNIYIKYTNIDIYKKSFKYDAKHQFYISQLYKKKTSNIYKIHIYYKISLDRIISDKTSLAMGEVETAT